MPQKLNKLKDAQKTEINNNRNKNVSLQLKDSRQNKKELKDIAYTAIKYTEQNFADTKASKDGRLIN